MHAKYLSITTVNITFCLSAGMFSYRHRQSHKYHHTLITANVMAYGRHISFVSLPPFPHKMNKDRVTFSFFSSCFLKCKFSTKLTCNHSANKLAVVANIVLCEQCTSLRPLSLWPCTWTLTVCFFLRANYVDVCDAVSP